ncbi:MAG: hypothetical protein M3Z33_10065 [Actinomycetota bacterium]|nr:hypothetical protein [Actinomycetota bacterium]
MTEPALILDPACANCSALLADDQRYCLQCGTRRHGARLPFVEILRDDHADVASPLLRSRAAPAAEVERHAFSRPRPRTAVALLAVMFATGVLLGGAVGPGPTDSLANGPLVLAWGAAPAVSPQPTQTASSANDAAEGAGDAPAPKATERSTASTQDVASTEIASDAAAGEPVAADGTSSNGDTPAPPAPKSGSPQIDHVFVLALGAGSFDQASAPATGAGPTRAPRAPYLAGRLRGQGQLLRNYYAIGHGGLAGAIALISGQAPNPDTQAECPVFSDLTPAGMTADGQALGHGCVYPGGVRTIADQLTAAGRHWRAYEEDMERAPGQPAACRHPAAGTPDPTAVDRPGDGYATRHNPFVYFHSVIDSPDCAGNDVPLSRLSADLRTAKTTPDFAYIAPSLCNGGDITPCADGRPGGYAAVDAFLKRWVPEILRSPAYRKSGLLVITFDEAPPAGPAADSSACCVEKPGPAGPNPGGLLTPGPGGGKVGALVLSPFVTGGDVNQRAFNHYSLLHSAQSLLGLGSLGYSGQKGLPAFGADVFTKLAS